MFVAPGQPITYEAVFKSNGVAKTNITVLVDIQRNGVRVLTGASATERLDGVQAYTQAGTNTTTLGSYVARLRTTDTTVDEKELYSKFEVVSWLAAVSGVVAVNTNANSTETAIQAKTDLIGTASVASKADVQTTVNLPAPVVNVTPTLTPEQAEQLETTANLVQNIAGGSGTYLLAVSVEDDSGAAVQGITVEIDGTGLRRVTDTSGAATFRVNDGEYSLVVASNSNYEEAAPVEVLVVGAAAVATITLTKIEVPASTQPGRVNVDFYMGLYSPPQEGIVYTLSMVAKAPLAMGGRFEPFFKQQYTTDAQGKIRFKDIPDAQSLEASHFPGTYKLNGPGVKNLEIKPTHSALFTKLLVTPIPPQIEDDEDETP